MPVYPALPEHRLEWHRDGSVGIDYDATSSSTTYLSASAMQALNGESDAVELQWNDAHDHYVCVYFAEPMTLYGGFFAWSRQNATFGQFNGAEYSTDSTAPGNGGWTSFDPGDWNNQTAGNLDTTVQPAWRDQYSTLGSPIADVLAVRYKMHPGSFNIAIHALHLYTAPSNGWGDADKLRIWHPTLDQVLAANDLDWGDPAVGSTDTKTFRVKNFTAYTAVAPVVGMEFLTDASPSLTTQFDLSLNGSTFASSVTLANIATGAISALVYFRRSTALGAETAPFAGWVVATAATYT